MNEVKLWLLYSNPWNHLTVCKQMNWGTFKNDINKTSLQIIFIKGVSSWFNG